MPLNIMPFDQLRAFLAGGGPAADGSVPSFSPAPAGQPGALVPAPSVRPALSPAAQPALTAVAQPPAPPISPAPAAGVMPGVKPTPFPRITPREIQQPPAPDVKFTPPPNQADYKPKWWERVLGGAVAGARGYVHDPNAIEEGSAVTNRRFNRAMTGWKNTNAIEQQQANEAEKQYGRQSEMYRNALTQDYKERSLDQKEQANEDKANYQNQIIANREENSRLREERDKAREDAEANKAPSSEFAAWYKRVQDETGKPPSSGQILRFRASQKSGAGDEIAQDRLEERRQKNLEGVQKDISARMDKHDAAIQKRVDAANLDLKPGSQEYKQRMAQIERDDYKGKVELAKEFASRSGRFGEKVEPPQFEPWEQSYLSDDERSRLLKAAPARSSGTPIQRGRAALQNRAQKQSESQPQNQPQKASQERMVVGPDGKSITAVVRNGKWVNKATGKPL